MRCLSGIKFNMKATVLDYAPVQDGVDDALAGGHFETIQDEDTGAIQRVWIEDAAPASGYTNAPAQAIPRKDINCYARGFTELGFRSTANTQTFEDGVYRAVEVIQMTFPSNESLSRGQYITNIRDRHNNVLWLEEELGQPTIFDVQGVTPVFDAFGTLKENVAVLKRAANQ